MILECKGSIADLLEKCCFKLHILHIPLRRERCWDSKFFCWWTQRMRGQNSFIVFVNTSHHPRRTQDVFKVKRQTVLLYLTFCFIFSWFFVLRFVFPFYLKFSHWKWNYNIIHSSINLVQLGANRQFINFECKWSSCQFQNFGKTSPFSRSLLTFRAEVNISLFLLFESYVFSFPLGANASLPGFSCGETNSCWSLGCQIKWFII